MLNKKQLLLKSIRELLSLKVSIGEIVENLREVGVSERQAKQLIEEAKKPEAAQEPEVEPVSLDKPKEEGKPKEEPKPEEKAEEIEREREQATEQLAAEAVEPEEEQAEAISEAISEGSTPSPNSGRKASSKKGPRPEAGEAAAPVPNLVEDIKVSRLWEKGILGTVNQRLSEMKALKKGIDAKLDEKVAQATKKELEKIRVLFDSQRSLLVSKVDAELESKAKEFAQMIEAKLQEMRKISEDVEGRLASLDDREKKSVAASQALSIKLSELEKAKESLLSSFNSEMIESRSETKKLVEEMNQKLASMDERINKTLQLENQIVEGLVSEAEQRIEQMISEKEQGLSAQEEKLEKHMQERLQEAIPSEFTPEQLRQQMKELEEFKQQFVAAIKENAEGFNKGVRRLNAQAEAIQKQFTARAEKIDKKIEELDRFEKNFAKEIGLSLQRLTKKKK